MTTVYPVASQSTLRDLVAEFKSSGPTYQRTVKASLKGSYSNHYRAGIVKLLSVLEFYSNNTAHRPVLDALELVGRYAGAANQRYYPPVENPPDHRGLTADWKELAYRSDKRGKRRVVRMVYEFVTFQALRDQLRCKEIWVVGAGKWSNPAEDLPTDFEERRSEHYEALRKPLDATEFVGDLQAEMRAELDALKEALPKCPWLDIRERRSGAIKLIPLAKAPEPQNLRKLKKAVRTRWGAVPLIDILTGLWLRVRQKQQERNQIPWPADDLLDGLRFYLCGTSWTNEDHREFSQMFWKRIAEPTIGDNLAQLLNEPGQPA